MAATFMSEKPQKFKYENGILTATRVLQFKTARGDGPSVFVGLGTLPREGASHPDFPGAFCKSIELSQQENGVEWLATLQYSSEREDAEDPLDVKPQITWSGEMYSEAISQDTEGNAIVNSAGDYFVDPTPVKEKSHLIAKIVANTPVVPDWVLNYRDVVNSADITIDGLLIPAGKALIRRPEISPEKVKNELYYREVSFDVHIHPDGWNLKPLDAGFRQKVEGVLEQITNSGDDEEPTTPVPLDGEGLALTDPTPESVVFLDFTIYESKDFSVLPGMVEA